MAFQIGRNCRIHETAVIDVREGFLGEGSVVGAGARIEGRLVEIGRESVIEARAHIGGSSRFDAEAFLKAGDWFHLEENAFIGIACGVTIGHEFGAGRETKIFTSGAYTDSYNMGVPSAWAPVVIGDHVWLPNAWINPGVIIGSAVVVAPMSLVQRDLPSGCLAGGLPAEVIREKVYPNTLDSEQKKIFFTRLKHQTDERLKSEGIELPKWEFLPAKDLIKLDSGVFSCEFDLKEKKISGGIFPATHVLKDQLRRNGVRFRFEARDGLWKPWLKGQ